jgi:hypothetical protein
VKLRGKKERFIGCKVEGFMSLRVIPPLKSLPRLGVGVGGCKKN